ncbi:hypothetical protein SPOG_00593 [Schizosaccharomyces cryophilus OY26]|uniref:Uncharacterized protein n=1 Tax=Schizosaccharomyces cryophilus (strain OY26 / ATCC MYA-4695 / CBS 11777 / NBRC 106824 / NRRL Y48691) TaxID=653667 RepID=S9VYJ3_SCHCR|nr:uncharacterized protein SPOG_00593 [Schizosaccharomyces cryophilus OY26]EPY50870.1 hypothetical protein SPOG_00593 [Schizosaccharomyces cryophilus OY26]
MLVNSDHPEEHMQTLYQRIVNAFLDVLLCCVSCDSCDLGCPDCDCEDPTVEIAYADIDIPKETHFLLLNSLPWIPSICEVLGLGEFELPDYYDIPNTFTQGSLSSVFHAFSGTYLKSSYELDESGFFMPDKIYHFTQRNTCAQENVKLLLKSHRSLFNHLCEYLRAGPIPISVLIHHVMLFQFYPPEIQESLWIAVEHYLSNYDFAHTKLLKLALQNRLGCIRMYLINPNDIYALKAKNNWVAVTRSNFLSYLQLRLPLCESSLPYDLCGFEAMLHSASSEADIGWLSMMHCIGNNGHAFPIHMYMNTKDAVFEGKVPESALFLYNTDAVLFKKDSFIRGFYDFCNQLLLDLCKCRQYYTEKDLDDYISIHPLRNQKTIAYPESIFDGSNSSTLKQSRTHLTSSDSTKDSSEDHTPKLKSLTYHASHSS